MSWPLPHFQKGRQYRFARTLGYFQSEALHRARPRSAAVSVRRGLGSKGHLSIENRGRSSYTVLSAIKTAYINSRFLTDVWFHDIIPNPSVPSDFRRGVYSWQSLLFHRKWNPRRRAQNSRRIRNAKKVWSDPGRKV